MRGNDIGMAGGIREAVKHLESDCSHSGAKQIDVGSAMPPDSGMSDYDHSNEPKPSSAKDAPGV